MNESAVAEWDVSIQKNAARKVVGSGRGSWSSLDLQHDMQLQGRLRAALFWEIGNVFGNWKTFAEIGKTKWEAVVIVKRFSIIQSRNNY
jgi:hypothetical protein